MSHSVLSNSWSDLCVSKDPTMCWVKETPDSLVIHSVKDGNYEQLRELWELLETEREKINESQMSKYGFAYLWREAGLKLRVKHIPLSPDCSVYLCRSYRLEPRRFSDLGLSKHLESVLLDPSISSGVGIILGKPGAGKTTFASSFLKERSKVVGGLTWTIETPVEIDIQGRHGNGYIFQRELGDISMISDAVRDLVRATPNVMFVGEVIDDETAREVVQASQAGFLVICTYHGSDIPSGLERFSRAAGGGTVSQQFSESFSFAIHLDLILDTPASRMRRANDENSIISKMATGNPPRILSTRFLFSDYRDSKEAVRGSLRNGEFAKLKSIMEKQKRYLTSSAEV